MIKSIFLMIKRRTDRLHVISAERAGNDPAASALEI